MKHPSAVTACNLDLENLVTDSNRSIATLAITTLLKTGSESSIDRLMKQISSFMSEISDEFKVWKVSPSENCTGPLSFSVYACLLKSGSGYTTLSLPETGLQICWRHECKGMMVLTYPQSIPQSL